MKIDVLRKLLKSADREMLLKIVGELYKHIPKAQKEGEGGMDLIIRSIVLGEEPRKTAPSEPVPDYDDLENEISTFIANAEEGYYIAPNRVVPKAERPKWRFKVMGFVKSLSRFPREDRNYLPSIHWLKELFLLLCQGCGTYIFRSDDPFRSIGIEQEKFFQLICDRYFVRGCPYDHEQLKELIGCAVSTDVGMDCCHEDLVLVLINHFQKDDPHASEMAKLAQEKFSSIRRNKSIKDRWELARNLRCLSLLILGLEMLQHPALEAFENLWQFRTSQVPVKDANSATILFSDMLNHLGWLHVPDDVCVKLYETFCEEKKIKPDLSSVDFYQKKKAALAANPATSAVAGA